MSIHLDHTEHEQYTIYLVKRSEVYCADHGESKRLTLSLTDTLKP